MNNLQELICHKTQATKKPTYLSIYLSIYLSNTGRYRQTEMITS